MSAVFINKKAWRNFSSEQESAYIDAVFAHYRETGFPYFKTTKEFRDNEFRKLAAYDFKRTIDRKNRVIGQSMHGLSLAWSYFPHSWNVECNGLRTPLAAFNDDKILKAMIKKRMIMGDNMSDNGLRKMMKLYSGNQSVSNFRPTAAAALYSIFAKRGSAVWDMSSGFGGRLLGAAIARVNYIGTDPSTRTYEGLKKLAADYCGGIEVLLHKLGSEVYTPPPESLSFAFTSPPYFDLEKYSDECSQSYVKFPSIDEWCEGFLAPTIMACHIGLKKGGVMALNIANTKKVADIEARAIFIASSVGFKVRPEWKLALSNPAMKNKTGFKYEPIYIFQK